MSEAPTGNATERVVNLDLNAWSEMVGVDIVGQIREQARSRNLPA